MTAAGGSANPGQPTRLDAYMGRTQNALDLLALLTLWLVVVPPGNFGRASEVALTARISLSVIYGVDMTIRSVLADRHWRYPVTHPVGVLAVVAPPLRIVFSLRLLRETFQRGNIRRFMVAALILLLNGMLIVYLYERDAPGGNIRTVGDAIWWGFVTVTTVGYGDYFPVTTGGRITAVGLMGVGLITLAVVTAQVSSSFIEQVSRKREAAESTGPERPSLEQVHERLGRIEQMLAELQAQGGPKDTT
ncbi:MAG TPA: potassium channel family protein [Candidatus Dormibacteraeota bacterium]